MTRFLGISLLIVSVLLCIAICFVYYRGTVIEQQSDEIANLTANVNVLIEGRKKDYADKVELAKRNEELEQEAQKDTSCFTWTTDISGSPILVKLRQN